MASSQARTSARDQLVHGYRVYSTTTHAGAVAYQALAGTRCGAHVVATVWPVRRTCLSLISGKT